MNEKLKMAFALKMGVADQFKAEIADTSVTYAAFQTTVASYLSDVLKACAQVDEDVKKKAEAMAKDIAAQQQLLDTINGKTKPKSNW